MSSLDDAIRQMRAAGMPDFPAGHPIVNAGRITRYGPKKKAWYLLYEFRARSGAEVIGGRYGMWGEIESARIEIDWKGISAEERERHQRERADVEAREKLKREQKAGFASARARAQWDGARREKPEGIATYLERKGVVHQRGIRYQPDGTVLVPMIRYDVTEAQEKDPQYRGPRRLVGLQKITPDGEKRFNKGMGKEGAACRLGPAPKAGELILVAEGIATGLSLVMALEGKHCCFVAFDAGNLTPALTILRKLHPQNPFLICADDDAYLVSSMNKLLRENHGLDESLHVPCDERAVRGRAGECLVSAEMVIDSDGVPGIVGAVKCAGRVVTFTRENAGRKYAHRAAEAIGNAAVIFPLFVDRALPVEPDVAKLTDFNDLHKAQGLAAVRAQLVPETERLELSQQLRRLVREEVGKASGKKPKSSEDGKGERPVKVVNWDGIFERYTFIYPSDTAWDAEIGERVKVAHMKLLLGDQVVKWWLEHPRRRVVNSTDLVFEPGSKGEPGKINLFRGLPLKPSSRGACDRLRALLQYICGEAGQDQAPITDWVLKWLALPLQRPGAKNLTALVLHGPEGAGKNMFFGAIREIYGQYSHVITQMELEDRFNGWLSRQLLLIANEVISRAEMQHHVGMLKNMVTEPVLPIREMFMPIRYETNHANFVFLTNELKALQIMPGDRRYMVIRTPAEAEKEFYAEVVEELGNGGVEALYAYLLEYPLGDFAEHTRPLVTAAKLDLIEMGLSSPEYFWEHLHDGRLYPLKYQTCKVLDLYAAYLRFCGMTGERNPRPMNQFVHQFKARNGVRHSVRDVDTRPEDSTQGKQRRQAAVFLMGQMPDEAKRGDDREAERRHIRQSIEEFAGQLIEFMDQSGPPRRRGGGKDE